MSEDKTDGKPKTTWDLTIWWKDEDHYEELVKMLTAWTGDCTRLQACRELAPETGKWHLQTKCTWRNAKRWSQMKKLCAKQHFEVSVSQCFAYCAKLDSKLIISHDSRAPGSRTELVKMKAIIDEGGSDEMLWDEHFGSMCRYNNAMSKYRALKAKKRHRPNLFVEWVIGKPGDGKSYKAGHEEPDAYWLNADGTGNVWWDAYDGESVIVIDDFRPNMFTYEQLLKLLSSEGKYRIAHKGGSSWLHCTKVILTSYVHPDQLYSMYDYQLERRITKWTFCWSTKGATKKLYHSKDTTFSRGQCRCPSGNCNCNRGEE